MSMTGLSAQLKISVNCVSQSVANCRNDALDEGPDDVTLRLALMPSSGRSWQTSGYRPPEFKKRSTVSAICSPCSPQSARTSS